MPYASDAQRRLFHALESKGEMPHSTVKKWDRASKGTPLPERVRANTGKEKTAMSMNPDTAFRAAFLEELARTGAVAKVAAHSEPFIDDSDDAVSQEDVEQYGHGKGMGKAKKRKPVPKTAPAGEPSELARAISKVLGGSNTPAGGAAAAIMKSAESVSERMAEVKQKAQAGAKAYHEGERTPGLGERMENVQKSVLPKPKQPTHPAIRAAKTTGQIIGNVATSPWR